MNGLDLDLLQLGLRWSIGIVFGPGTIIRLNENHLKWQELGTPLNYLQTLCSTTIRVGLETFR